MKVLLPASEVAPVIKLGGLGDVIGSLPIALEKLGVDVDVIVPFFPTAKIGGLKVYKNMDIQVPFNGEPNQVDIYKTKLPNSNVDLMLIKSERFDLGGKSAFLNKQKETEMFAFFDRAVVEYVKTGFNTYDVVHCNDWHTGLIATFLKDELELSRPAVLFTIHNLLYQGVGDTSLLKKVGIVPGEHRIVDWDAADGDINMMYQGIASADYVSTVSPSYAWEITTREFAGDFADVIKARAARVAGILNGIDYEAWPRDFDEETWREKKAFHKTELQKRLGLQVSAERPLFLFIGRLDPAQKGLDLLLYSAPKIAENGGQFALLGTGDSGWRQRFNELENKYKGVISCNISFDAELSRSMYASGDFLLVPSKYEPCGLIQMLSMWYGCLPIAHDVGGLKDSIKDGINGFKFTIYSNEALWVTVSRALSIYFDDKDKLYKMTRKALREDFGWEKSAVLYKALYEKVVGLKGERA